MGKLIFPIFLVLILALPSCDPEGQRPVAKYTKNLTGKQRNPWKAEDWPESEKHEFLPGYDNQRQSKSRSGTAKVVKARTPDARHFYRNKKR